ncbi:MAG: type II toxin-antitoxin system prevent-host-death family antitoxin [Deltaproteobacteria bacterium]|nr:type II toxin-antitoxin system prevent-host-death family antitoxin [Deltaproteobacteria bacterium]
MKISELKNRLSHYLRQVQRGEPVLVSDRHRVIARIDAAGDLPSAATEDGPWLADLERRGIVRRGTGRLPRGWLGQRPKVKADVLAALLDERREGR